MSFVEELLHNYTTEMDLDRKRPLQCSKGLCVLSVSGLCCHDIIVFRPGHIGVEVLLKVSRQMTISATCANYCCVL